VEVWWQGCVLGSSDQRKVTSHPALFLKCEKIPALVYVGKGLEYRPFSYVPIRRASVKAHFVSSSFGRTFFLFVHKIVCVLRAFDDGVVLGDFANKEINDLI
jgi:hypothetical protein